MALLSIGCTECFHMGGSSKQTGVYRRLVALTVKADCMEGPGSIVVGSVVLPCAHPLAYCVIIYSVRLSWCPGGMQTSNPCACYVEMQVVMDRYHVVSAGLDRSICVRSFLPDEAQLAGGAYAATTSNEGGWITGVWGGRRGGVGSCSGIDH